MKKILILILTIFMTGLVFAYDEYLNDYYSKTFAVTSTEASYTFAKNALSTLIKVNSGSSYAAFVTLNTYNYRAGTFTAHDVDVSLADSRTIQINPGDFISIPLFTSGIRYRSETGETCTLEVQYLTKE